MRYLMGSRYFFGIYEDFISHDTDYVELTDDELVKSLVNIKGKDVDIFVFRRKSKEQMIEDALSSNLAMTIGKFLIPEFCKELSFTISDLKKLRPLLDNLDKKHLYEKVIYDSYISNNDFVLSDEQRLTAYRLYKDNRKDMFK